MPPFGRPGDIIDCGCELRSGAEASILMSTIREKMLPRVNIPYLCCPISSRGNDAGALRLPVESKNPVGVPFIRAKSGS